MSDETINQDQIDEAAKAENQIMNESPEVLKVMNQHLNNRVILLRARVVQLEQQMQNMVPKPKQPQDRKKPAKRKVTPKKKPGTGKAPLTSVPDPKD